MMTGNTQNCEDKNGEENQFLIHSQFGSASCKIQDQIISIAETRFTFLNKMAGLDRTVSATLLLLCVVVFYEVRESNAAVLRELITANSRQAVEELKLLHHDHHVAHYRNRRQTIGQGPPNYSPRKSSFDDDEDEKPFIPKIDAPPPGSILTYDGRAISTSIGAFSIVPKSDRKTPSINRNRPQYATFRGDLPPPIPDVVPRDLPQFKSSRSIAADLPPGFN